MSRSEVLIHKRLNTVNGNPSPDADAHGIPPWFGVFPSGGRSSRGSRCKDVRDSISDGVDAFHHIDGEALLRRKVKVMPEDVKRRQTASREERGKTVHLSS